jgi:ribonuclease HI
MIYYYFIGINIIIIIEEYKMEHEYILRFDGCSKGNPGPGGAGAVIYKNNKEIWSSGEFIGEKVTNNVAEYQGLLLGFRAAILKGIINLHIEGDSLLIIKQMKGEYKVSSSHLYDYYEQAKNFEKQFQKVTYEHILRSFNKRADALANQGLENCRNNNVNVCVDGTKPNLLFEKEYDLHDFISIPFTPQNSPLR